MKALPVLGTVAAVAVGAVTYDIASRNVIQTLFAEPLPLPVGEYLENTERLLEKQIALLEQFPDKSAMPSDMFSAPGGITWKKEYDDQTISCQLSDGTLSSVIVSGQDRYDIIDLTTADEATRNEYHEKCGVNQ